MLTLAEVLADARCSGEFNDGIKVEVNTKGRTGITPLHFMATLGDILGASLLLDAGADIHAADHAGRTPLHEAVALGHAPLAALLVQRGASIEARAANGDTPRSIAAARANPELLRALGHAV